jgi:acyl-CoA thioester hydrolase
MAATQPYAYTFTVPSDAVDFNGHVDNVIYLRWMVDAALQHSEALGWSPETMREKTAGTWVARAHTIEYLRPAFAHETLRMETWLETLEKVKAIRRYRLYRADDGVLLCRGESVWVFVHPDTMRPMRIPDFMHEACSNYRSAT